MLVTPRVVWHHNLVQIRAAAAYVLNWQLAAERTDYLGAGESPTLVQHYWSLALEEQFYLVWPLLLILTLALGVRRLTIGLRASLAIMLGITAAASFVLSVTTAPEDAGVRLLRHPVAGMGVRARRVGRLVASG